eukprot:1159279-Pelagomonas_calceolata.AAC.25
MPASCLAAATHACAPKHMVQMHAVDVPSGRDCVRNKDSWCSRTNASYMGGCATIKMQAQQADSNAKGGSRLARQDQARAVEAHKQLEKQCSSSSYSSCVSIGFSSAQAKAGGLDAQAVAMAGLKLISIALRGTLSVDRQIAQSNSGAEIEQHMNHKGRPYTQVGQMTYSFSCLQTNSNITGNISNSNLAIAWHKKQSNAHGVLRVQLELSSGPATQEEFSSPHGRCCVAFAGADNDGVEVGCYDDGSQPPHLTHQLRQQRCNNNGDAERELFDLCSKDILLGTRDAEQR